MGKEYVKVEKVMWVRKGVRSGILFVKMLKKDGKEGKYLLKEVERFWDEKDEKEEEIDI